MNTQLKQRIDEKLERRSEQRVTEVLNFVEFLESRERPAPQQLLIFSHKSRAGHL